MNTKKRAAAITYDPENNSAPIISAAGQGVIAENIIEKAREAEIPVVKDAGLASMLAKMSIGDEIPKELYEVVARVLIFVSEADAGYGRRHR